MDSNTLNQNWEVYKIADNKYALVNKVTGKVVKKLIGYFSGAEIYPNGLMLVHITNKGQDIAIRVSENGELCEEYVCKSSSGKYNPQTSLKRYYVNDKFVFAGVTLTTGDFLLTTKSANRLKYKKLSKYQDYKEYSAYQLVDGSYVMISNFDDVADFRATQCFLRESGTIVQLANGDVGLFNGLNKNQTGKLINLNYDGVISANTEPSKPSSYDSLFLKNKGENSYSLYSHRLINCLQGNYTSKFKFLDSDNFYLDKNEKPTKINSEKFLMAQTIRGGYSLIDSTGDKILINDSTKKITKVKKINGVRPNDEAPLLITFEDGQKKFLNPNDDTLYDVIKVLEEVPAQKDKKGNIVKEKTYQQKQEAYGIKLNLNTDLQIEYEFEVKLEKEQPASKMYLEKREVSPWLRMVLVGSKNVLLKSKEILDIDPIHLLNEEQRELHRYVLDAILNEQQKKISHKFPNSKPFIRDNRHQNVSNIANKDSGTKTNKDTAIKNDSKSSESSLKYATFEDYAIDMKEALRHSIANAEFYIMGLN